MQPMRKSCPVIQGNLTFVGTISKSINLDSVETVLGGILYDSACRRTDDECPHVQPFTISSSTLTTVNQTISERLSRLCGLINDKARTLLYASHKRPAQFGEIPRDKTVTS